MAKERKNKPRGRTGERQGPDEAWRAEDSRKGAYPRLFSTGLLLNVQLNDKPDEQHLVQVENNQTQPIGSSCTRRVHRNLQID